MPNGTLHVRLAGKLEKQLAQSEADLARAASRNTGTWLLRAIGLSSDRRRRKLEKKVSELRLQRRQLERDTAFQLIEAFAGQSDTHRALAPTMQGIDASEACRQSPAIWAAARQHFTHNEPAEKE